MSNFDRIFALVATHESGVTNDPADPGNWTGGKIGVGICRGTKFGISAAAYPRLDIANLSLDDAKRLYQRDYWEQISGERLPPALAFLVFDAAINNGTERATRWLQQVAGVVQDGLIGPTTLDAVSLAVERPDGIANLCTEFLAQRLTFIVSLPTWKIFGLDWARRLCRLPYQALTIAF